ncbi:hypothetical protein Tco_1407678 [Tanacetum coccineum]
MATKPKLDADLSGKLVDQAYYRSKIKSLMYLTSSRPDIVQAVCYCARYQARPTEKHLKEVKRIFRYLRGTINMGLCWMSKKQDCTAMSSAEAEYVALSASCAQVMWMRTQLKDYGFNYNKIHFVLRLSVAIAFLHATRATIPTSIILVIYFIHGTGLRKVLYHVRPNSYESLLQQEYEMILRFEMETLSRDSLNLPDHRYKRWYCSLILAELDSSPHTHPPTTKTCYKHQDSKNQESLRLKEKE